MQRLSRTARVARWTLPIVIALFVVVEAFCIHIFILDRRIARELGDRAWLEPTTIVSNIDGKRRDVARLYGTDWRVTPPVKLESLPDHVGDAFLAAEDVRFRYHIGIDPIGILRAATKNVRAGGITAGGSTIGQQMIKQRFLTADRTWRRKFTEMALAIALDVRFTKNEILELYLNDVYLGHYAGSPVLGVDEASRLYFDKLPNALRVDEAALLAAMIRAPNRDNPEKRPDLVRARRNAILKVMLDKKWIDDRQYSNALSHDVDLSRGSLPPMPFPYYIRALRAEVVKQVGLRKVLAGGLTIVCEMDPRAQREAERAARVAVNRLRSRFSHIRNQSREDPLQVAILSVDPSNGGVRALVGGSDYQRSTFDRTVSMRRQPGSAFKTFAYLSAIVSKEATTASLLLDSPVTVRLSRRESWEPHNYDEQYRGRVTLRESFERSLNVPTVRLTQDIGVRRVASTAEKFGFDDLQAVPALPLGVDEVSMWDLTAAYTAFPNLGERAEPSILTEVRNRKGKTVYEHKAQKKRVVDKNAAYVVHTLLRGVVKRGTARRLSNYGLGYVAGKTGTTNDYRDAWFVGYTADMVTTVWVGFDRGAPLRLSSAEAAIPVWGDYMSAIPHDRDEPDPPDGVTFRSIDPETGMLWRAGCPGPIREVFLDGTAPTRYCPVGVFGRIVRRVLFDRDNFDEPPAITFDKFRKWANDVDRNRQNVERGLDRLFRMFD